MIELSEIVGQKAAIDRLQRSAAQGRMPQAYLFVGPAGVGRRTTATALAKTLLCAGNVSRRPAGGDEAIRQACGQCEDCRLMQAGSHPDFHLVYKELARYHEDQQVRNRVMQGLGIDVIRRFLIAPVGRTPTRGRAKVFLVREADSMSIPAQNALLKTLEEPPPSVTIILICRRPEQMLPTMISRCAVVRFGLLPRDFVAERLKANGLAEAEAQFWAGYTGGSVGQALRLAHMGLYPIKRDMLECLARPETAEADGLAKHLVQAAETLAAELASQAKRADEAEMSKALATRRASAVLLQLLASVFRDALLRATGASLGGAHLDQPDLIAALAQRHGAADLARIIEQISRYDRLLWRNVNPKLIWDNVAITCATAEPLRI